MELGSIKAINDWIVGEGLLDNDETALLSGFCNRCIAAGLPLVQAFLMVDTLHPVQESEGYFWNAEDGQRATQREFSRQDREKVGYLWLQSPFVYLRERGLSELRIHLEQDTHHNFGILDDLRQAGHSDYLVLIERLSGERSIGEIDSLYSRWSTSRPGGFTDNDLDALRSLVPALALSIKAATFRRVAQSLAEVYLGRDPGRRVLEGRIVRGKVDSIRTVLWYSDMENYTSLSETIESGELIAFLNDYSDAVISSIYEAGGDVLKLIGDGVLAIFNHTDLSEAAHAALDARDRLRHKISALNSHRAGQGNETTEVYLGLHVGEVFYGNIGSDERLDFTVIGRAVNEVCRVAGVCRTTNRSLLVSDAFLDLLPKETSAEFAPMGTFRLKGIQEEKTLHSRADVHSDLMG